MAVASMSDADQIGKLLYVDGTPETGFRDTPLWAMLSKTTDFYGTSKVFASRFTKGGGASKVFATARANARAPAFGRWNINRASDFVDLQIDIELWESMGNTKGAQVAYMEEAVKAATDRALQRIERNLFRNQGGMVAVIEDGGDTDTITVDDPADLAGFDHGDIIVSSNTDGTSGTADAFPQTIANIDRVAGTIETDVASWDVDGGFSDGDGLFIEGDFGLGFQGLDSWLPPQNPTSALFNGQDRTLDYQRLSGIRYEASAASPDGSIERAFVNAGALTNSLGGRTTHIFMNSLDFGVFLNDIGNRAEYDVTPGTSMDGKKVDVAFSGIRVMLPSGNATVYPNRHCQRNTAWMLDLNDISWEGLKEAPRFMDLDGNGRWFRMALNNLHAMEAYLFWNGNLVVRSPGCHCRVDLTALFA